MKQCIEQIYQAVTPSSIISRKVQLKQKGADEFAGLCPFHNEKTPSFTVSDKKGFYHCFGCGAHGDVFGFLMKQNGLTFKEALEDLAKLAGVRLPRYTPTEVEAERKVGNVLLILEAAAEYYHNKLYTFEGKHALNYLKNRGLSDETIERFRLGFAPPFFNELMEFLLKNYNRQDIIASTVLQEGASGSLYNLLKGRVIFPIINKKGKVIAFGGRILGQGEPKYINSPENPVFKKGHNLYGMNTNFEQAYKQKQAIVVEGYMDVISLYDKGARNAFAPLGTALKIEQLQLLWPIVDDPIICMDSDSAGRKAAEKTAVAALAIIKAGKSLKFVNIQNAKDPDELVSKYGIGTLKKVIDGAQPLVNMLFDIEKMRKPIKTPEQQLDLKERLVKLSGQISDQSLQRSYRQFFMEKFYKLFSKRFSRQNAADSLINQEEIITSVMNKEHSHIQEVMAILVLHPDLLLNPEVISYLTDMEIPSKVLDTIRVVLLSFSELPHPLNDEVEIKNLQQEILTTLEPEINLEEVLGLGSYLHLEEPKAHLERILKFNELQSIREKVVFVQDAMCKQPSNDMFDKLRHLKHIEEQLKLQLGIN